MSVQYVTPVLAQFDANLALITNEVANLAGGGFKPSAYRFTPDKEPDSAIEGLYYLDVPRVQPKERYWGTGENIWTGTITVQLGYYRGGGDYGGTDGGDRRTVAVRANDDCMRVSDVCENPANYNRDTTGIRWIRYAGHRRAFELKKSEVWQVDFDVEWRSDVTSSAAPPSGGSSVIDVASLSALQALATSTLATGSEAFVEQTGQVFVLQPALGTADATWIIPTLDDATRQWGIEGLLNGGVTFLSPEFDLTATPTNVLLAPGLTGKYFIPSRYSVVHTVTAGSASTPATVRFGNDGSHANILGPTAGIFTTANFTGFQGPGGWFTSNLTGGNGGAAAVAGGQSVLDVTIAATGVGLTWKARIVMMGRFI